MPAHEPKKIIITPSAGKKLTITPKPPIGGKKLVITAPTNKKINITSKPPIEGKKINITPPTGKKLTSKKLTIAPKSASEGKKLTIAPKSASEGKKLTIAPPASKKLTIKPKKEEHISSKHDKNSKDYKIYFSIDIGARNFNICVMKRYIDIKRKPPVILKWLKFSMFEGQKKIRVTQNALRLLTAELDALDEYIKQSSIVLVEKQPGGKSNVMMRIEQHTLTYFDLRYPNIKCECIPSKWKFIHLGAPEGMTPYRRKRWSIMKCKEFLIERERWGELAFLEDQQKLDDFAETYTQIEGYIKKKKLK